MYTGHSCLARINKPHGRPSLCIEIDCAMTRHTRSPSRVAEDKRVWQ